MTKKPSVRNVGTVCVGTILLGLGCTQRDEQRESDRGETFDEPPVEPERSASLQEQELPRPNYGPLGRKVVEEQRAAPAVEVPIRLASPVAPQQTQEPPRQELLIATSETAIAVVGTPPPPEPAVAPPAPLIVANDRTPLELPELLQPITPPAADPEAHSETIPETEIALVDTAEDGEASSPAEDQPSEPLSKSVADGFVVSFGHLSEPKSDVGQPKKPTELAEPSAFPSMADGDSDEPERFGETALILSAGSAAADPEPLAATQLAPELSSQTQTPIAGAEATVEPPFDDAELAKLALAVPSSTPSAAEEVQSSQIAPMEIVPNPLPAPVPVPDPVTKSIPAPAQAPMPAPIPPAIPSAIPASTPVADPAPVPAAPQQLQSKPDAVDPNFSANPRPEASRNSTLGLGAGDDQEFEEEYITARRSIPAGEAGSVNQAAAAETKLPSLQSMVPPERTSFAMASIPTKSPPKTVLQPANDDDTAVASQSSARPVASLVPPSRAQSTLGLDRPQPETSDTSALADDNNSAFTASAQPPVLSYQDELILEIRIRGVEATDTVLAYGTRTGVYLPLGALARILDVAIIVSDDGNYANGWVLDEDRTVTINLRAGTLEKNGNTTALTPDTAVAFDGDLFFRADQLGTIMPINAEVSLRAQAVTLKTLEPFPFEERMRREAQRRRLAARGIRPNQQKWPREETPYRVLSLPLADVEVRALSDSGNGTRIESDVLLAGDLGFLTAEAFVGGDSVNGLTTSLVEVGRMDPDGDLLGPLKATSFAVGDVSTVSMPIGLRGVAGRGFFATNTPAETVSVFERIDLRGILPDGYEVELYRNDILVASTRDRVNGQYEFLQVPVDFGLNVFRLVFFGPQGQRSEQVRKISVGDGRLSPGKLVYRIGAVQKDENVFGVRNPRFIAPADFGAWRASAEVSYGLSTDITTILSGAWFETANEDQWVASAGVRTGIAGFAVKGDLAASNGNSYAASLGIGGRIGSSAFTLSHVEYSGDFIDETRSLAGDFLRRSTELDFNSTVSLGNPVTGLIIPLTARARHLETATGRAQTNVAVRASTRGSNLLASNTLEYSRTTIPQAASLSRLFGNFDLASVGRGKTRGRLSLGYQALPDPELLTAAAEVDYAIDEDTAIRGSVGYAFQSKSTQLGLSAVRDFERFSLALDGTYALDTKSYSVGLRLGFSFGRDPLRGNFFVARHGLASSGGASVRAFRDMDGDGVFGPTDSVLPEVDVVSFNQTVPTDDDGIARLSGLGRGRGVSIQVDATSLPDIDLAPAKDGIEIIPRPGRIHSTDFPIVALSEVEGSVSFVKNGARKGVSGVRLILRSAKGEDASFSKTEIDGYFFFERVKPGTYSIALDPEQSQRLNLCMSREQQVSVGFEPDILKQDIEIGVCDNPAMGTQ